MAGITVVDEKGHKRIYATFSFRNEEQKALNVRKAIGKIDLSTNLPIFNHYFKGLLADQGIDIDLLYKIPIHDITKVVDFGSFTKNELIDKSYRDKLNHPFTAIFNKELHNINISQENQVNISQNNDDNLIDLSSDNIILNRYHQIFNYKENLTIEAGSNIITASEGQFTTKNIGAKFILDSAISQTGLLGILKSVFPTQWDKILTLSSYLLSDNVALMYCQDWVEENETFIQHGSLESQRISELLSNLNHHDIMSFWDLWADLRRENEYLALDITSISSYSNLISELEFGHNRDGEKLPQLNLCMLFGEQSGLPVFSSHYQGSFNDVKILTSFLDQLEFFGDKKYNLVMDKGFYSLYNIKYLLRKKPNYNFMMAVPFTTSISKKIVSGMSKLEEDMSFEINNDTIMGYSFVENIDNNNSIIYHCLYNEYKYMDAKKCLKDKAIRLKNEALSNPSEYVDNKDYKKYLIFNNISNDKNSKCYDIRLNLSRIAFEIKNSGWLIIASNDLSSTYKDALTIYRNKDVVEKSFDNLKNSLGLSRLHTQSSKSARGKIFIALISLIISSYIHKVMKDNSLDNKYTITSLLKKVNNLKLLKARNLVSFSPLSKEVKIIFKSFGIKIS